MLRHLKRWWFLYLLLLFILYLIIGAIAPFAKYRRLSEETIRNADILAADIMGGHDACVDRVMLLESNKSALEERLRLFSMAEERIILSTFDMREGNASDDIAALLLHKAEEGVKISVLIDGFNGSFRLPGKNFFYALSSHPNIEIRLYNPINLLTPWTSQGRMHDKYIIVDDLAYILGGRNTFDYFLGDYETGERGMDREVLVYNTARGTEDRESSLWQVLDYFETVWDGGYCEIFGKKDGLYDRDGVQAERQRLFMRYEALLAEKPELFGEHDYAADTYEANSVTLLSGDVGIYGKEPAVLCQLKELMCRAENRVLIHTPYVVGNSYMYEVLREIKQEVPDAVLLLNSVENGDNFCASSDYIRNKPDVVATGITIYEYDGGESSHGKSIVIDDDISIIGSYNFDLRSTYVDTELMLVIESREFTTELTEHMEKLEEKSRLVVSSDEYLTPDGLVVQEIPFFKKIAMLVFGFLAQGFRYLL